MIDPKLMTRYGQTHNELEETFIFSVCVANKAAVPMVKMVNKFLENIGWDGSINNRKKGPFAAVKKWVEGNPDNNISDELKRCGIGCYNLKARCIIAAAYSNFDLKVVTPEELEVLPGVGPKTSRFFVLHTREGAKVAAIDTHMLKWLSYLGYKTPKSSPKGKEYAYLERVFLSLADRLGMEVAELDLTLWNYYAGHSKELPKKLLDCDKLSGIAA